MQFVMSQDKTSITPPDAGLQLLNSSTSKHKNRSIIPNNHDLYNKMINLILYFNINILTL